MKSQGLGDTVKKVLDKLGFKHCESCENKRKKLNREHPYLILNPVKGFLTNDQIEIWEALDARNKTKLNDDEMDLIQRIYCELFHTKINPCRNCGGSGWLALIQRIDAAYNKKT